MSKEKRSNLAIFTLAGSILISSVIVSINQVNAHSINASKRDFLALKQCIANFQKNTAKFAEYIPTREDNYPDLAPIPTQFEGYVNEGEGRGIGEEGVLDWIADGLEC